MPSLGLVIAQRTGILETILPGVPLDLDTPDRVDPGVRLAALFAPVANRKRVNDVLKALKFSNAEADQAAALVAGSHAVAAASDPYALRRALGAIGRAYADDLVKLDPRGAAVIGDPLVLKELAITGNDLMQAGHPAGKALGDLLVALLDRVHRDPGLNSREQLLALATA